MFKKVLKLNFLKFYPVYISVTLIYTIEDIIGLQFRRCVKYL